MNRIDLVEKVSKKCEKDLGTEAAAKRVVDATIEAMAEAIKTEGLDLRGFAKFSIKDVKARTGHNPKTGEKVQIPAKRKVVFKAHKELKF